MRAFYPFIIVATVMIACNSSKTSDKEKETAKDTTTVAAKDTSTEKVDPVMTPPTGAIGGLSLDMSHTKVVEMVGQPDSKSKAEEWGADGLMHQDWTYKSKGITINMSSDKDLTKQVVASITVEGPATIKTEKNIGIGSLYKDVMTAYEKEVDKETSDKTVIVVGSVYGGMIFNFKNDKVEKIFIGAAAE